MVCHLASFVNVALIGCGCNRRSLRCFCSIKIGCVGHLLRSFLCHSLGCIKKFVCCRNCNCFCNDCRSYAIFSIHSGNDGFENACFIFCCNSIGLGAGDIANGVSLRNNRIGGYTDRSDAISSVELRYSISIIVLLAFNAVNCITCDFGFTVSSLIGYIYSRFSNRFSLGYGFCDITNLVCHRNCRTTCRGYGSYALCSVKLGYRRFLLSSRLVGLKLGDACILKFCNVADRLFDTGDVTEFICCRDCKLGLRGNGSNSLIGDSGFRLCFNDVCFSVFTDFGLIILIGFGSLIGFSAFICCCKFCALGSSDRRFNCIAVKRSVHLFNRCCCGNRLKFISFESKHSERFLIDSHDIIIC